MIDIHLILNVGLTMQAAPSTPGSGFIPPLNDVPPAALNVYETLEQEIALGVQAQRRLA